MKTLKGDEGAAAAMGSIYKEESVDDNIDQQMLEEAVRQSLEETGKSDAAPDNSTADATVSTTAAAAAPAPAVAIPSVPTKPMARFVRDVTFPDGTSVQPGSVFLKTWRVRNDGAGAWPEGVVLCCAGGDVLVDQDTILPVPAVAAGGEVEITMQMKGKWVLIVFVIEYN